MHEPLPFADEFFFVITFSKTLEHLPVERVNFVLGEISRVLRPGGILIASLPNQASLENRLHLLRGGSVFDLPDEMEIAHGVFKHIRNVYPRGNHSHDVAAWFSGGMLGDGIEQLHVPGEVREIHVTADVQAVCGRRTAAGIFARAGGYMVFRVSQERPELAHKRHQLIADSIPLSCRNSRA